MSQRFLFHSMTFMIGILLFSCTSNDRKLPFLGEKEIVRKKVQGKDAADTIYKTIPDFSLLNQDSTYVTSRFFDGKIYVADFFFTSCPTTCPKMHHNLSKVYRDFRSDSQVLFLSHSVDFKNDSPSILKEYAERLGVSDNKWQFVTGSKEQIYTLAEQSYVSAAMEEKGAPGGYAHSGYFLLVDRHRRLRGAYDGTDSLAVRQLVADIRILLREK